MNHLEMQGMFELKDQVAIVTGGHAWLGYDIASILAEYGCSIVITSRNQKRADEAAKKISSIYHVDSLGLTLEQTDYQSVRRMAKDAFTFKERIDILINNAGGGAGKGECDFLKRDPEDIAYMIDCNLTGVLYCCKEVGSYMAECRSGRIVNIASIAALVGRDRRMYHETGKMEQPVEYAAAKAGIVGLTQDLAAYMAPYHVRVNCISPGGFDKGDLPAAFQNAYSRETVMNRMGIMGKEIMGAALYLSSEASSYVTGHNLVVDGGFHICK